MLLAADTGLTISNQVASPSVNAGNQETYTLTVTNNSTTAAEDLRVTDFVAPGATQAFISGGPAGTTFGSTNSGALTATINGLLTPGQTATFTVTATLNTPGVAYNAATIDVLDEQSIQAYATAVAFVNGAGAPANGTGTPAADLQITSAASATTIAPGTPAMYTVVVTNTDSANASNGVVVTDVLPDLATNITTSGPSGVAFTINKGVVKASVGNLAAGASATLTITADIANNGIFVNTANVEAATADNNQANNSSAATVIEAFPPLLSIGTFGPASGTVGQPLVYYVNVTNDGGVLATGASVTDVLPAGLRLVSATDGGGKVVVNGNTITDTMASLAAPSLERLVVTAIPTAALGGQTVTNTASLTFNGVTQQSSATTAIAKQQAFFLQSAPGDDTITTEVTKLYWNLLGRAPDAAGLQGWVAYGQVNENAHVQQMIVAGFLNSPEYKTHYVTSLYEIFLGRAPDPSGLAYWTAKLGDPGTPGGAAGSGDEKYVLAAILGSDEFYNDAGGIAQDWINALYQDLLGRPADGGGLALWQHELSARGAADRDGIVRDILSSPEAVHDLLDAYYPAVSGTSSAPLPPAGGPAGTGLDKLALLTGGGWENLYFRGPYGNSPQANDVFFAELLGGTGWDLVQYQMLTAEQYAA